MRILVLFGLLLLVLGLAAVAWGVFEMIDNRKTLKIAHVEIFVDKGEFPPVGIAGGIMAGAGVLMVVTGLIGGRKPRQSTNPR